MYKNFTLTEKEKKAILEAHSTKGYKQPMNEEPASKNITEVARIKSMMKKSEMNESFWDNIFGKSSVGDARDSSMRQSGSSLTGRDDSNYGEKPSKENFYIVFDGKKYYEEDIEYADYNDTGDLPRLENGKLIVGNPAWRL